MKDYEKIESEIITKIEEARISVKKTISLAMQRGINRRIVEAQIKKIAYSLFDSIVEYGDVYKRMAVETRRSLITNSAFWYKLAVREFRASGIPLLTRMLDDFILRPPTEDELQFISEFENISYVIGQDSVSVITELPSKFKQTSQLFAEDQMQVRDYTKKINDSLVERSLTSQRKRPDKPAFRFSSRNHAEMSVRFDAFNEQVAELRNTGVRLVLVSQHINASERCSPWQNRVYSLDGTSGTTDDNNRLEFVPLLEATGTEGLGLFGYNCRHRLIEYLPDMRMQTTFEYREGLAKEQRRVDIKMRDYERKIRKEKEKQILAIDPETRSRAIANSQRLQNEYRQYARGNDRVVQTWRTRITQTERQFIRMDNIDD